MSKSEAPPPLPSETTQPAAPLEEIQGVMVTEASANAAPPEPSLSEELDRALAPEEAPVEVLFSDSEPQPETRVADGEVATEVTSPQFAAAQHDAEPDAPRFDPPDARTIHRPSPRPDQPRAARAAPDRQLPRGRRDRLPCRAPGQREARGVQSAHAGVC